MWEQERSTGADQYSVKGSASISPPPPDDSVRSRRQQPTAPCSRIPILPHRGFHTSLLMKPKLPVAFPALQNRCPKYTPSDITPRLSWLLPALEGQPVVFGDFTGHITYPMPGSPHSRATLLSSKGTKHRREGRNGNVPTMLAGGIWTMQDVMCWMGGFLDSSPSHKACPEWQDSPYGASTWHPGP